MIENVPEEIGRDVAQKRGKLAAILRSKAEKIIVTVPLSEGQKALWFLNRIAPESPAYNIGFAFRIFSGVDVEALRRCVQALVDRHSLLRARIRQVEGEVVQDIPGYREADFNVIDLPESGTGECEQIVKDAYRRPFDLTSGNLFEVRLFNLDRGHVLLMRLHHIIGDFFSLHSLMEEFRQLYGGSGTPVLPVPKADYRAFLSWQEAYLKSAQGEADSAYWMECLSGKPGILELPCDKARPPLPTFDGGTVRFTCPSAVAGRLKAQAESERVTVFTVLMSAFQVLLHRYSGQESFLVGTPTSGRAKPEFEGIVGYFVNPVAVTADLSGNPSFRSLLRRVGAAVLGALKHQDFPFLLLVERLGTARDPSRSPLFQSMFVLQKARASGGLLDLLMERKDADPIRWADLLVAPFRLDQEEGQFDLTLEMMEFPDAFSGCLKYNRDVFAAETIERMAIHFQVLLENLLREPDRPIADASMMEREELARTLSIFKSAEAGGDGGMSLSRRFEERARDRPNAVALVHGGSSMTYGELNARANFLAGQLISLGVGPEKIVGLCAERSFGMIIGIVAILKAGGVYLPIEPSLPSERKAFQVRDSGAMLLVADTQALPALPALDVPLLLLEEEPVDADAWAARNPANGIVADNAAYLIYTSGSTGLPKGVLVTHGNVDRLFTSTSHWFDFGTDDVWTLFHSFSFDFSVWEIWGALLYGGRLVIVPRFETRSPKDFLEILIREKVTVLNQTPSAFRQLIQEVRGIPDPAGNLALRYVIFGGEALEPAMLKPWYSAFGGSGPRLVNMYGITETTVHVTYRPLQAAYAEGGAASLIGRPIPDLSIYILDEHMRPVPIGVPGEIYVGGKGLARGYLGRAGLTAQRFVPDPFGGSPGERLYKTGDIGRLTADHDIEYRGRTDFQIKIRGHRIEIGELEAVLNRHPGIRQAVAMTAKDPIAGFRLSAYLVPKAGRVPTSELRAFMKKSLPDYMVPSQFFTLASFPLTQNGKIDFRALPVLAGSGRDAPVEPVEGSSKVESLLMSIWKDVLGVDKVGPEDNFFELGGDSILSLQVVSRANQSGIGLTARHVFQYQTIRELAAAAGDGGQGRDQGMVEGEIPLTPIQTWFFERHTTVPEHWNQSLLLASGEDLDSGIVRDCLERLVLHHDGLRSVFYAGERGVTQVCAGEEAAVSLTECDFTSLTEHEALEALASAASTVQSGFDLRKGPVLRALVARMPGEEVTRLLLVAHHLAVDGVSWRILLEDFQSLYGQYERGGEGRLPDKTSSYKAWSEMLRAQARESTLQEESRYWLASVGQGYRPLPVDMESGANLWGSVESRRVRLDASETESLLHAALKSSRLRINDILLAALSLAMVKWVGGAVLVDLEGHGRDEGPEGLDLSRTVGWFTSIFPFRLDPAPGGSPEAILADVKRRLAEIPSHGSHFGVLKFLAPDAAIRDALRGLPSAGVSFNYLGQTDNLFPKGSRFTPAPESHGPDHAPSGSRDYLLEIVALVSGGEMVFDWNFSNVVHFPATIEKVAGEFILQLRRLSAHCLSAPPGRNPGDFPMAALNDRKMKAIVSALAASDGRN